MNKRQENQGRQKKESEVCESKIKVSAAARKTVPVKRPSTEKADVRVVKKGRKEVDEKRMVPITLATGMRLRSRKRVDLEVKIEAEEKESISDLLSTLPCSRVQRMKSPVNVSGCKKEGKGKLKKEDSVTESINSDEIGESAAVENEKPVEERSKSSEELHSCEESSNAESISQDKCEKSETEKMQESAMSVAAETEVQRKEDRIVLHSESEKKSHSEVDAAKSEE